MYTEVLAVTLFVFVASFILSAILTLTYLRSGKNSVLMWSSGMWLFAVSVLLEIIFALGIYRESLIDLYLFLVAILVQLLSMGSVLLLKSRRLTGIYAVYSVAADIFLLYSLITTHIGSILQGGVVFGALPMAVITGSSLVTFPAAVALVAISALSYRRSRNTKLLSIIVGTVVVSVAGTLYIVSFPAFLYVAELVGIILLWAGFVDFGVLRKISMISGEASN